MGGKNNAAPANAFRSAGPTANCYRRSQTNSPAIDQSGRNLRIPFTQTRAKRIFVSTLPGKRKPCGDASCSTDPRRFVPLQSMAGQIVCYPAAATGCRHCRPAAAGCFLRRNFNSQINKTDSLRSVNAKTLRARIYSPQGRVPSGGSKWLSALPGEES